MAIVIALRTSPPAAHRAISTRDENRRLARSRDAVGQTLITLGVDDRLLDRILTFDAGSEDLEDGGDAEPDDHEEMDVPPC